MKYDAAVSLVGIVVSQNTQQLWYLFVSGRFGERYCVRLFMRCYLLVALSLLADARKPRK